MKDPTDENFIVKLRTARGKSALEEVAGDLYERYFQELWRYGQNRKDRLAADDLKDLIQQTLIDLIEKARRSRLSLEQPLGSYLRGMLNYKILNFLRTTKRAREREQAAVWLMQYSFNPSPEQEYIARETEAERIAMVNEILEQLSDTCRRIFRLMMEEKTYPEIAEILNYQAEGIKVIVHRCKKDFRALVRT